MAVLLSGTQVSERLCGQIRAEIGLLREHKVIPTLGIVRVGDRKSTRLNSSH